MSRQQRFVIDLKCPVKRPTVESVILPRLPDHPLITIIVPSFNQGRFIRATIDSILAQDYRPIRIHVIDGASSDETIQVLESYGKIQELDWVSEKDSGVVEAVNKGFAKSEGDIIAIQSSDDCYLPGALRAIVREFRADSRIGLVYGDTVKVDAHGSEVQKEAIGPWSLENLLLLKTWIPQPSCFFRRELLQACGGWDESIPYTPDTDLWIRMAFRTQVRKIDLFLSARRIHDQQRDMQTARIWRDYRKMIRQSPDIAAAPKHIRRAAFAGSELLYRRYNPTDSQAKALWHDFRALMIYPRSFSRQRWWAHAIVFPLRRLLRPLAPAKRRLGCWLHERWRAEVAMSGPLSKLLNLKWEDLCNRNEWAAPGDSTDARVVESEFTSYLTLARIFPRAGARLAAHCFHQHPLPPLAANATTPRQSPQLSIVLPVGGEDRLRNFTLVLNCLLNQSFRDAEVIVIEHSNVPLYESHVPEGVVFHHVPMRSSGEEFNKARLFNLGVGMAQAPVVLLHDADILVPAGYVCTALQRLGTQFDAIRPIRLLFYLSGLASRFEVDRELRYPGFEIETIAQNSQGGSTFVRKSAYQAIGGHDERFRGWGGEDLEFLERLKSRNLFRGGMMPALHLWHAPAAKKVSGDKNLDLLRFLRNQPVQVRIAALLAAERETPP